MSNLKKQAFAYDVSTIGGYSDQVGGELLAKALIGGTTASVVTKTEWPAIRIRQPKSTSSRKIAKFSSNPFIFNKASKDIDAYP